MQVPQPWSGTKPVHLLVDSTGLKLGGPGERKLHLGVDTASGVNHTVRLPRTRRPASYSTQLVTRCRCLGM